METRINKIMDRFQKLKMKWERSFKNRSVSLVEIYQQFSSLSKVITEISNQALLARVSIPICIDISSLTDVIAWIKQNGIKGANFQIDMAFLLSDLNLDSSFHHELNLSSIDPPSNRMQMIYGVVKIQNPKLVWFRI